MKKYALLGMAILGLSLVGAPEALAGDHHHHHHHHHHDRYVYVYPQYYGGYRHHHYRPYYYRPYYYGYRPYYYQPYPYAYYGGPGISFSIGGW